MTDPRTFPGMQGHAADGTPNDTGDVRQELQLCHLVAEMAGAAVGASHPQEVVRHLLRLVIRLVEGRWGAAGVHSTLINRWAWLTHDAQGGDQTLRAGEAPGERLHQISDCDGTGCTAPHFVDAREIGPIAGVPEFRRALICPVSDGRRRMAQIVVLDPGEQLDTPRQEALDRLMQLAASALERCRETAMQAKPQIDYRWLFTQMQAACIVGRIDVWRDGRPHDVIVIDVNPAFEALSGLPAERIIGRSAAALLRRFSCWKQAIGVAVGGISRSFTEYVEQLGRWFEVQIFRPAPGQLAATILDITDRVQAEERLRQSAAQYRSIFENMQDVYYETTLDERLLVVSPSIETISQYRHHELLGTCVRDLFADPEQADVVFETLRREGQVTDYEVQLLDRDGREIYCAITSKLLLNDNGTPDRICGTLRDITQRKQQELEVRRSEAWLRQVIDLVPHALYARDADGKFLLANRYFGEAMNIDVEKLIGHRLEDLIPLEDEWRKVGSDQEIFKSDQPQTLEVELPVPDGERRYLQLTRVPFFFPGESRRAMLGIVLDLTDRRRNEMERNMLATAAEQMDEALVITDAEARIRYVNSAFERITGYSREECIGQNTRILRSGQHPRSFYEEMWATLLSGRSWSGRLINKRKDGTLYHEVATITPLRDATGRIVQFIGVKRDVSVEVQIQEQMRHAQKMEAIGTLAGGVAHDFNNILAAIVGYTELVKAQVQDTRLRTNLEQVLVAGRRARDLVRQILTFSRQVEGERRPMQVQTIVREVLKLLRASLPATIEIHERVDLQCPTVQADPTQIHQLTMNLCTNAYQAMPDGGVLEVSLRQIEANAELREKYPHLQPGRHVLLSVADTGIGMDATLIDKIFDPFFTTREKGGGTGLGLATVHGIVTALGGVIGVESTPGVGSRFDIYLPALDTAQTAPQQRQPRTPRGNGERVLWIDDEKAILQFGKELLERLGYHVTIANGSLEGLELFRATPDAFDVVITDQTMPKMTGTQLARAIKQLRPKVPIVLSSGYSETLTDDEIRDSGIITMIEKPFTLNDMARAVRAALENRPELMKERDLPTID